jgi:Ca-activated chloride channel homolog
MELKNPLFLLLFVLFVPMVWVYLRRERQSRLALRFPDLSAVRRLPPSLRARLRHSLLGLRLLGLALLIIALARPRHGQSEEEVSTEGVDIMLVLDLSGTMQALDFQPKDRLYVAKETIKEFISKREHDRIGLVAFAGRAYTKCPLTLDYGVLDQFVDDLNFGDIEDGTAIGTAIATASARLAASNAKSKVIVLATDGDNNRGDIAPLTAAKAAGELGIRIYAIGVGKEGEVPFPMQYIDRATGKVVKTAVEMVPSTMNEQALQEIADATKGRFFRAQSAEQLKEIYGLIDKLEKTEIKTMSYTTYTEQFFPWLLAGALVLLLELALGNTVFRRIP